MNAALVTIPQRYNKRVTSITKMSRCVSVQHIVSMITDRRSKFKLDHRLCVTLSHRSIMPTSRSTAGHSPGIGLNSATICAAVLPKDMASCVAGPIVESIYVSCYSEEVGMKWLRGCSREKLSYSIGIYKPLLMLCADAVLIPGWIVAVVKRNFLVRWSGRW